MIKGKQILVLSTSDDHRGANEFAYKMTKYLNEAGWHSILLVRKKTKSDNFIVEIPFIPPGYFKKKIDLLKNIIPKKEILTDPEYYFLGEDEKNEYISSATILSQLDFTPDLILTGLTQGFVTTKTLAGLAIKTKAKIFMITIDMIPFTGGCHYAWDCKGYQSDCSNCPAALDEHSKKWVKENFKAKKEYIKRGGIKVLTGSGWAFEQVKQATFFKNQTKVYNFNSLIDTEFFNNKHRLYAKNLFDIPIDSKVIFAGSYSLNERRKGLAYFLEALNHLWNNSDLKDRENIIILIAGESFGKCDFLDCIPFQKKLIPFIKDYRLLSLAYQASDVFVCASIEDSGPMMVSEALSCGTPVVGFNMGVVSNMVINGYNGYVAELKKTADLGNGILEIINLSQQDFAQYSKNARAQVEEHSSISTFVEVIKLMIKDEF